MSLEHHKRFNRLRSVEIKELALIYYNEYLEDIKEEDRTEAQKDIFANAAITNARRIHVNNKSKEFRDKIKELELLNNDTNVSIQESKPKRRSPKLNTGVSEYTFKQKRIKDGEVIEVDVTYQHERKGIKFHREYDTRGKEIYEYYKPRGPNSHPICSKNDVARNFGITPYLVGKIITTYETNQLQTQEVN